MAEKDILLSPEEVDALVGDEVEDLLIAKELMPGVPFGVEMFNTAAKIKFTGNIRQHRR